MNFRSHPDPYPDTVQWRAFLQRVVDGDTLIVLPDMGWEGTTRECEVRLEGIDTEELNDSDPQRRERAKAAKARVQELLPAGSPLRIRTSRFRRSFTRYRAEVYFWNAGKDEAVEDLAEVLTREGFAKVPL